MESKLANAEKARFQVLLTKAVDGELTASERQEFDAFRRRHAECERQWKAHKKLKEVTTHMKFKSPPAEVWDSYWLQVYNRLERGLAWIFVSIGAIILLSYALYQAAMAILSDASIPDAVKWGVLALVVGTVMLLVSVMREKMFVRKRDKYREVLR